MKNFILGLVIIIPSFAYSQIGELKVHDKPIPVGKVERLQGGIYSLYTLSFIETAEDKRLYILTFTNENTLYDDDPSPDIRSIGFFANQNELNYFYDFLKQGFEEDVVRSLEIGQDTVSTLTPISRYIHINVDFKDGTSAMLKLKRRQLDKLFGKK